VPVKPDERTILNSFRDSKAAFFTRDPATSLLPGSNSRDVLVFELD